MSREIKFNQEARERLLRGIKTISAAVSSTLGPRGKTVVIESQNHTNGITITKDGVTVAKSITLEDPMENLAVQIIRDASERTAIEAGDGTTTSVILAEAMCEEGLIVSETNANMSLVVKSVREYTDIVIEFLQRLSKPVTEERLKSIAAISANNNREIGDIIAETYRLVGMGGLVTVEKSMNEKTYPDVTQGVRIDRGYTSRYFVNNQRKDECILEDPLVLVTDVEINGLLQIEDILRYVMNVNRPLVIIAPIGTMALNTLVTNVLKQNMRVVNITPPSFGYKSQEMMSDIAAITGGMFFSQQAGDDLSLIGVDGLGSAKKITVSRDTTVMVAKDSEPGPEILQRIEELKGQLDDSKNESERKFISERISGLKGMIGVIYVGGSSDVEQKELLDLVDDSVCAVRSSLEEGIIPGGGVSLLRALNYLSLAISPEGPNATGQLSMERMAAYDIMYETLTSPIKTLLRNADYSNNDILDAIQKIMDSESDSYGIDLKEGEWKDMFESGIIDPLKVTKNALINAVSVATTLINTSTVITYKRENK